MSDSENRDIIADDYGTISSDGAYVHITEGLVRLLFYRDNSFPIHGENGSLRYDEGRRTILHEVRLPHAAADQLGIDLSIRITNFVDRKEYAPRYELVSSKKTHPFLRFHIAFSEVKRKMVSTDGEGKEKIAQLVEKTFSELDAQLNEIVNAHYQEPKYNE